MSNSMACEQSSRQKGYSHSKFQVNVKIASNLHIANYELLVRF